jgi:hypothetical protein
MIIGYAEDTSRKCTILRPMSVNEGGQSTIISCKFHHKNIQWKYAVMKGGKDYVCEGELCLKILS